MATELSCLVVPDQITDLRGLQEEKRREDEINPFFRSVSQRRRSLIRVLSALACSRGYFCEPSHLVDPQMILLGAINSPYCTYPAHLIFGGSLPSTSLDALLRRGLLMTSRSKLKD